MEYKVYEVLQNYDGLNIGDEVVVKEDLGCDRVGVEKITLSKNDGIFKSHDKKSYWFSNFTWVDKFSLRYLRIE